MRNRLKTLGILAVFVAASFVGVKGSAAATGIGTGQTAMGTITLNAANPTASVFSVGTNPASNIGTSDGNGVIQIPQSLYLSTLCNAYITYYVPNPPYVNCDGSHPESPDPPAGWYTKLDIYTVACAYVTYQSSSPVVSFRDDPGWTCTYIDSGSVPGTSVSDFALKAVDGTMPIWPLQSCAQMWSSGLSGCAPTTLPVPALSALAGTVATFDVFSNWCSFVAPPGYTLASFTGLGDIGCAQYDQPATLASASGNVRMLAASDPYVTKVKMQITSPRDCRVPKVKGLMLRKAKARLRAAHCGVSIRYVEGHAAGRVRYQPMKVRTDRPRGWKVKLAVVR